MREAEWVSPAGRRIKIRSTRFVSLVQRAIVAIRYEVEVPDEPASVVLQSELVANEPSGIASHDPRAAAALEAPLVSLAHVHSELRAVLVHQTRASGLQVAAGMDHQIDGPEGTLTRNESEDDMATAQRRHRPVARPEAHADQVRRLRVVQPPDGTRAPSADRGRRCSRPA